MGKLPTHTRDALEQVAPLPTVRQGDQSESQLNEHGIHTQEVLQLVRGGRGGTRRTRCRGRGGFTRLGSFAVGLARRICSRGRPDLKILTNEPSDDRKNQEWQHRQPWHQREERQHPRKDDQRPRVRRELTPQFFG